MTDFNPLAGAILGSAQAQQILDTEKQRQVRRAQALRKNVADQEDRFEHQVESADEIHPVDDGEPGKGGAKKDARKNPKGNDDPPPQIDVKA